MTQGACVPARRLRAGRLAVAGSAQVAVRAVRYGCAAGARPAGPARRLHRDGGIHRRDRHRTARSPRLLRPRPGTVAAVSAAEAGDDSQAAWITSVPACNYLQHTIPRHTTQTSVLRTPPPAACSGAANTA